MALSACLSVPKPADWLDVGFRSPGQTFRTFRTAFADGRQPGLELRCFSSGFKAREGLSELTYREFREDLLREEPLLRTALSRARISSVKQEGKTARLEAKIAGRALFVELVREDYWELWDGEELLADDLVRDLSDILALDGDGHVLRASLPAPSSPPTEVRLGGEWKIDRIEFPQP
jgi:hypothetical protein